MIVGRIAKGLVTLSDGKLRINDCEVFGYCRCVHMSGSSGLIISDLPRGHVYLCEDISKPVLIHQPHIKITDTVFAFREHLYYHELAAPFTVYRWDSEWIPFYEHVWVTKVIDNMMVIYFDESIQIISDKTYWLPRAYRDVLWCRNDVALIADSELLERYDFVTKETLVLTHYPQFIHEMDGILMLSCAYGLRFSSDWGKTWSSNGVITLKRWVPDDYMDVVDRQGNYLYRAPWKIDTFHKRAKWRRDHSRSLLLTVRRLGINFPLFMEIVTSV